jgi:uncharacterized protein YjbI with pentapeptide repeats
MKTVKPQRLGLLTRCFEHQRQFQLGVSILGFIPLGTDCSLLSEVALWAFTADELGKDSPLDVGIPKAYGEFLVTGTAYVPGGQPKPGCVVRVRLDELEKRLFVFGDRQWKGDEPTEPELITQMPLDWEHAFGGEGCAKNPLGKGFEAVSVGDGKVHFLPNIEDPVQRVTSRGQRREPAGFGPIDLTWPQRLSKSGTHDQRWLKEEFPGFARDIDWRFFNLAPRDQHFETALRGDEPYLLECLHPTKGRIEGRLPGFTARCFINRQTGEGESFEEVPTRLTTVWFFPNAERAVLIFHGSTPLREEDAADVLQIMIGAEHLGEAKGQEHYRKVFDERLDKEKGPLLALRDSDLLPTDMKAPDGAGESDASPKAGEGLLRKNLRRKLERELEQGRAAVASYGLDPDIHGPPPLPPEGPLPRLDNLMEFVEQAKAEAEKQKKDEEARDAERDKAVEKLFGELGLDYEVVRAERQEAPRGPPTFTAKGQIEELRRLADSLKSQGIPADELEEMLADPEKQKLWSDTEARLKDAYRLTAHRQEAAPEISREESDRVRRAVLEAVARGDSLAGGDLTGTDLSGLDLRGADFEGAFLENANLAYANLDGANLERAVLAHASLKDATLTGARLAGANLGAAILHNAQADGGADLSDAILAKADLSGANFRGARLKRTDCSGAVFGETDFSGVEANELIFMENDLKGLKLAQAQMKKCNFLKVDVTKVDFGEACLAESVFVAAKGRGARFRGADMGNVRFVEACQFDAADFSGASLVQANLRGTSLGECDFSESRLDGADLSECELRRAKLYRAVAREARFVKADLSEAVMTSMNLMGAVLQRATICGADLRGSNLYQADLARVHADKGTKFADAYTKKARTYPRRSA